MFGAIWEMFVLSTKIISAIYVTIICVSAALVLGGIGTALYFILR